VGRASPTVSASSRYDATIAAVIVEPMAGSTTSPRPKAISPGARSLTSTDSADLRRGHHRLRPARPSFAAERYGVTPDLITFAKGII
jgi:beta-alanine--pyruvate transaminase